jgi:cysteine desulfurase/selenocysteine lyase
MNWSGIRAEFPALENRTYLNTATFGQLPLRTRAAVERHFARRGEFLCADFLKWFDDMDQIRGLVAQLVHCEADDVAFVMNAATALSILLGSVDWRSGDRIVTLRDEFPNQYYFAASLAERGVELVEMHCIESLPANTRAVLASTVNYTSGYRPDLEAISRLTHAAGALLYVDGTQSVGALEFDVRNVRPDMLAVDGYKWLLCPNGATFFCLTPELRRIIKPPVMGWRSDRGWRSVDDLNHGAPTLSDAAEKYEAGMLNFPSLYGMRESVRMMLEIGPERIEQRVLHLAGMTAELLRKAGAQVLHENTNIVAANWPGRDVSALAKKLEGEGIIVAARHGNLRVSPHFYNNEADLDRLAKALA